MQLKHATNMVNACIYNWLWYKP